MLRCRVLFIEVLVLAALVLYLLFTLYGRHDKITTVASISGLTGGYAQTGDTLVFKTLYPHELGYTVTLFDPLICTDDSGAVVKTLHVTGDSPKSCKVTSSSGQQGSGVVFSYSIKRDPKSGIETPDGGSKGPVFDSANPCKQCSPVMGTGYGGSSGASEPTVIVGNRGDVSRTISCKNNMASVDSVTVVQGNDEVLEWLPGGWTTSNFNTTSPNPACSNGSSFSPDATPYCQIQGPGTYKYSVTLPGCGNGFGDLIIQAASPAETHN
jgi:hypothetical protein